MTVIAAGVSWYASHKAAQKASELKKTRNYQHLTAEEQKEVDAEIAYRCRSLMNLSRYARMTAVIAGSVTLYYAFTKNSPSNVPGGGPRRPGGGGGGAARQWAERDAEVARQRAAEEEVARLREQAAERARLQAERDAAVVRDRTALACESEARLSRYARGHGIIEAQLTAARVRGPEYARMGALGAALGTSMREARERAEAAGAAPRSLVAALTGAERAVIPSVAVETVEGFAAMLDNSRDVANGLRARAAAAAAAAEPALGGAGESPVERAARAAERERQIASTANAKKSLAEKHAAEERGNFAVAQAMAEGNENNDELASIYAAAYAAGVVPGSVEVHDEAVVAAPVRDIEAERACLAAQLARLYDLRVNAQVFYQSTVSAMRMLNPVMLEKALTMTIAKPDGEAVSIIRPATREDFMRLLSSSFEEQLDVLYDALVTAQQLQEFERLLASALKTHSAVEAIRREPTVAALQGAVHAEVQERRALMIDFLKFATRIRAMEECTRGSYRAIVGAVPQERLDAVSQARLNEIVVVVERIRGQLELLAPELSRAVLAGRA